MSAEVSDHVPAVPPIPPRATWERMEATAASILGGDADRGCVIEQGFRARVREFLPGREKKQPLPCRLPPHGYAVGRPPKIWRETCSEAVTG
ncbi:hypothetical protein ABZ614_00650 [Streptomyces sp. NPDC013178]|uniref:hypothetical protein n=1 Tax=unclassified Streptomyces TaxID=2593676 RepID=UPI0033FB7A28